MVSKKITQTLALNNARVNKVLHLKKLIDLFNENLVKCCTFFDNSSIKLYLFFVVKRYSLINKIL